MKRTCVHGGADTLGLLEFGANWTWHCNLVSIVHDCIFGCVAIHRCHIAGRRLSCNKIATRIVYKTSTITTFHIVYHNIVFIFLGTSKYESTSYLCTLFDIQCCKSVIRKLVYSSICSFDSSVNCIIQDNTSYQCAAFIQDT